MKNRKLLIVALIVAVMAVIGLVILSIQPSTQQKVSDALQADFEKRFPKGTPLADIEGWLTKQGIWHYGYSQLGTVLFTVMLENVHLDMAALNRMDVSYVLIADYSQPNGWIRVYFYFDLESKLIKFWIENFEYAL